jgi:HlyD family secretion protein
MDAASKKSNPTGMGLALIFFIAGLAVGGAGVKFLWQNHVEKSTGNVVRPQKTSAKISALGRIQPEGGVLNLGIPIPDRVLEIYPGIKEETLVKKGQELVKLESYAARALDLELVANQLTDARAKLEGITKKGKAQIDLDKLRIKQLKEIQPLDLKLQDEQIKVLARQAELAQENLKRLLALGSSVSPQELEQQKLRVLQADTELIAARQKREKAEKAGELEIQSADAQLAASEATLTSAQRDVPIKTLESQKRLAKVRLEESVLRAPSAGKILKILAHPGELVGGQQPILQMANTDQIIVIAEVYETDIHKIKKGDRADISGRALQKKLTGEVVQIGAMIGKNRVVDVDPTADVDRRVIEVRIRLKDGAPAASLINHQVLVEIDAAQKNGE